MVFADCGLQMILGEIMEIMEDEEIWEVDMEVEMVKTFYIFRESWYESCFWETDLTDLMKVSYSEAIGSRLAFKDSERGTMTL